MYLCRELWREIWSYDLTYRKLFDTVIREINLRFDDGRWWVRQSGLLVLGSRKYFFDVNTNNSLIMIDKNKMFDVNSNENNEDKKNYRAWSAGSHPQAMGQEESSGRREKRLWRRPPLSSF